MTSTPKYMTAQDFLRNGIPCEAIKRFYDELAEERRKTLIDPVALRRGQDWSLLAYQVVGAEVPERR